MPKYLDFLSFQGWRIEMEDAHSAVIGLPDVGERVAWFAVFDGHAGSRVSAHCAQHLLECVLAAAGFKVGSVVIQSWCLCSKRQLEVKSDGCHNQDRHVQALEQGLRVVPDPVLYHMWRTALCRLTHTKPFFTRLALFTCRHHDLGCTSIIDRLTCGCLLNISLPFLTQKTDLDFFFKFGRLHSTDFTL